MIELGILGLATSHAESFANYLESCSDVSITAVWDGEPIRDDAYVDRFCEKFETERVARPTRMLDSVDGVLILTANWDRHVPLAEPYLIEGVPVFVDKPLAGSIDDLERLAAAASNASLFGGSTLPFHPSVTRLPAGTPSRSLFCVGFNDPFYYGAHLTDLVRTIVDVPWTSVTPCDLANQIVMVRFEDDTTATLQLNGPDVDPSFAVLDVNSGVHTIRIEDSKAELDRMYPPLLDAFLEVVRGRRDVSDRLLDSARLLLAVNSALETEQRIFPSSDELSAVDFDGEAFTAGYEPYY